MDSHGSGSHREEDGGMKKRSTTAALQDLHKRVEQLPAARIEALNESLAIEVQANELIEQLRQAVRNCGKTHYALGKQTGIAPAQLDRFMRGERDLRFETVCRLCAVLGLELAEKR